MNRNLNRSADGPSAAPPLRSGELSPSPRWREGRREVLRVFLIAAWSVFGTWNLALGASASSLPLRPSVETSAFLAEVAAPAAPALGSWLISATAALSILALGKQFMRKTPLEAEFLTKREFQDFKDKDFADLRNRIDRSHETLANKLDTINDRLSDVGSLVARLDERTKKHNQK